MVFFSSRRQLGNCKQNYSVLPIHHSLAINTLRARNTSFAQVHEQCCNTNKKFIHMLATANHADTQLLNNLINFM